MTIAGRSDINEIPHKQDLSNPKIGTDGYGHRRHPTRWMVKIPGSSLWQRVYSCCISNAGTCYVEVGRGRKKDWHVIDGDTPKEDKL